ncbi:hypothetical protein EOD97_08295 [Campylobacter jejuni]|nr:hypothetical protein [Campylobacter jejuni]
MIQVMIVLLFLVAIKVLLLKLVVIKNKMDFRVHKGWNKEFQKYLLQPVDKNGKKIVCDDYSKCPGYENDNGGFDFTWTQHTGWRIDSKSNKRYIYISVFDNGDARGAEQPVFASQKYSRSVIYKIDQQNKTVEQIWEYGKIVEMNGFLL